MLTTPAEGLYKEKGSKFLAFAYPVQSEDEVKNCLEALRKEYFDARHHCYAYILGYQSENTRANDDGEPNNSAGVPILGQIRAKNLTNTLVVVVRYFGGTKLGVGGLIQAYKTATAEALNNAQIIEKQILTKLHIFFAYPQMNLVMRLVKDFSLDIISQTMLETCILEVAVRLGNLSALTERLDELGYEGIKFEIKAI
jgi:uncharacterized YigZ family protein